MAMYTPWEKNMRFMIIAAVAIVELVIFLALARAAFEVFTVPGAIIFSGIVGGIAISAILGIMRLFRMIDRREFMKEYEAAVPT